MINIAKAIFSFLKSFLFLIFGTIKKIFLNGLIVLLPITLTFSLFAFSWRIMINWLEPIKQFKPELLKKIPHSEVILIVAFIFAIGTLLKIFVLKSLINLFESILEKIPLVRNVYGGIKQLVHAFGIKDKKSFKQVVLVEFPRKGVHSIGFLTSKVQSELAPNKDEKFCHVYIPTTPNPTTGYLVILPEQDVRKISLTRQEAMALIISGGIIKPDRFSKKSTHVK